MKTFIECPTGKVPYWSEGDAAAAAKSLVAQRGVSGIPPEPYLCPRCDQWHIGRNWQAAARAGLLALKETGK